MPSFKRLSFEEVIEVNREMAIEGNIIASNSLFKE